jgi:hypothetical protein
MRLVRVGLVALLLVAANGCTFVDQLASEEPRGPGAAYRSYLAGSADTIVVEIDHAPGAGFDPDTAAENQFVDQLERITTKDIEVRASPEITGRGEDHAYTLGELRKLHREHMDTQPGNGTEVVHALFLEGKFQGPVAGLSFAQRGFALFKGQIAEGSCGNDEPVCQGCSGEAQPCEQWTQPTVREWKVTRSVAIHEAGHLLGLVNSPLPMVEDHEMAEDPRPDTEARENRSHSTNASSVMFWKVENPHGVDDLVDGGEVPWRFGEQDVRDARAIQAAQ